MNSLAFATIQELKKKLSSREISAAELLDFFIKRFETYDPQLKAALEIFSRDSILQASATSGDLAGIPGLVKDNIAQQGRRLGCASKILEGFVSTYDATAIARLKQQGSFLIGRANMDEFAMGSSTETSAYQKTYNPWDLDRVPGGSSGGSIAAVAAGLVPYALGSETGGSVRQPAGFCGIVGLKPTYGLVSRSGLVAYASSLDQIGVATRTVYDNALVLSAIAGHDTKDSSSLFVEKQDYTQRLDGSLKEGLRIGVIDNALNADGMDPYVQEAVESTVTFFERAGAAVKRVTMPTFDYAAAAYFVISRAEAASNLARFDGVRYGLRAPNSKTLNDLYCDTRHDGFGAEVASRVMVGNYVLAVGNSGEYYDNAKAVQRLIRREFLDTFQDVDVLICPVQPAPAFKVGAFDQDKLQMDLQDYFTAPVNLAGIPALALQCGMSKDQLPVGFQLIGPPLSEELLYRTAYVYEQQTPWHTMHPPKFTA